MIDITSFSAENEFLRKIDNLLQNKKFIEVEDISDLYDTSSLSPIAYTDNKKISINYQKVIDNSFNKPISYEISEEDYEKLLFLLKGLNYHELCHVLYTRMNFKSVLRQCRECYNILEDQRIENLFVTKYEKASHYFKKLYSVFFDLNKPNPHHNFVLLYGRRKILNNNKILKSLEQKSIEHYGEENNHKIKEIIDRFITTTNLSDHKRLSMELYDIIGSNKPEGVDDNRNSKESVEKKEEKNLSEQTNKDLQKHDKSTKDVSEKEIPENISDIEKEMNKEVEKSEKQVESEIIQDRMDIDKIKNEMQDDGRFTSPGEDDGSGVLIRHSVNKHLNQAKKLQKLIKRLKNELGNKTMYKQKKGRLDIRRAMTNNYDTKDFKKFMPERKNELDIDVSILLDSSGSMNDQQSSICFKSAWIISKALEETGNLTNVYEFSSRFRTVKTHKEKCSRVEWARTQNGGTLIDNALYKIRKYYDKFKNKKTKIIIVFTDGRISRPDMIQSEMKKLMQKHQPKIFWFAINGCGPDETYEKYVEKSFHLRDINQLMLEMPKLIKNIQLDTMKKVMRK